MRRLEVGESPVVIFGRALSYPSGTPVTSTRCTMSELSLWLDYYDDIYSDFDSRHYLKRRISEDFLHELRISKKYKKERVTDVLLLLPQDKRDENSEKFIIESLKMFFTEQFRAQEDKYRTKLNTSGIILITGIVVMIINSYISFKSLHSLPLSIVRIMLEPAGWFLLWLGFDFLFYDLREIRKEKDFFKEFSEANIHFKTS